MPRHIWVLSSIIANNDDLSMATICQFRCSRTRHFSQENTVVAMLFFSQLHSVDIGQRCVGGEVSFSSSVESILIKKKKMQ